MPVRLLPPAIDHQVTPDTRLVAQLVDCREGLKTLADNSVHAAIMDPPYGMSGMGDDWDSAKLRERARSAGSRTSSVGGLPVGQRFDRRQGPALRKSLAPVFAECYRVMVPGAFLVSFSTPRLCHSMATAAEDVGFEVRDTASWWHGGGQGKAAAQTRVVERLKISREERDALLRSIGGRTTPQLRPMYELLVIAQKPREGTYVQNWLRWGAGLIDVERGDGKQQTTIFSHRKPQHRFNHMATKPVGLMADLIRVFAPPNAVILDPFMGTGSTGVAAIRLGHKFIGFERDPQHFATAEWRLGGERLFYDYFGGDGNAS